jgi:hypothetical protein
MADHVPAGSIQLYTDEWQSSRGSHPVHATVRHGVHEWVRDDDHDGRCEVHCHTAEFPTPPLTLSSFPGETFFNTLSARLCPFLSGDLGFRAAPFLRRS